MQAINNILCVKAFILTFRLVKLVDILKVEFLHFWVVIAGEGWIIHEKNFIFVAVFAIAEILVNFYTTNMPWKILLPSITMISYSFFFSNKQTWRLSITAFRIPLSTLLKYFYDALQDFVDFLPFLADNVKISRTMLYIISTIILFILFLNP